MLRRPCRPLSFLRASLAQTKKPERGAVCAGGRWHSPVETAPRLAGPHFKSGWFHTINRSWLRRRTCSWRSAWSSAASAFSSNNAGNTSNGNGVTHANAAASFAARRGPVSLQTVSPDRTGSALVCCLHSCFSFGSSPAPCREHFPTKNPRLTGNRGLREIYV